MAESTGYRYQLLMGPAVRARGFDAHQGHVHAAIAVLSRYNNPGIPVGT